jgi:hypothetical protein
MATMSARRTARIVVLCLSALAAAGLVGAIVRQSYQTNAASAKIVEQELDGAAILHPLTTLLGELVNAQSAAVRGEAVDAGAVRKAMAGVAGLNSEYGVSLQSSQRFDDLSARVESALGQSQSGRAAYETYSGLVTLVAAMEAKIAGTSHLLLDPELDSYYVMDAAIVQLPQAMVYAGRATDLVQLAGGKALEGEDAVRAAVARFGVSAAAEAVSDGLNKSVDVTNRTELGSNITERLDAFRAAADAFAPPTMLFELSLPVDAASLAVNARKVYAAALPLTHRLIFELQALLQARASKLAGQWRFTAVAAGLAVVICLGIVWLLARSRPRGYGGPAASRGGRAEHDEITIGSMTPARALLDAEELVHIGRAVRARQRGDGDAG